MDITRKRLIKSEYLTKDLINDNFEKPITLLAKVFPNKTFDNYKNGDLCYIYRFRNDTGISNKKYGISNTQTNLYSYKTYEEINDLLNDFNVIVMQEDKNSTL